MAIQQGTPRKKPYKKSTIYEKDLLLFAKTYGEIILNTADMNSDLRELIDEIYNNANIAPAFLRKDDDSENVNKDEPSPEYLINLTSNNNERRIFKLIDTLQKKLGLLACQVDNTQKILQEKLTKPNSQQPAERK